MLNSRIASSILSLAIILPLVLIGCNDKTISGKGETSQLKKFKIGMNAPNTPDIQQKSSANMIDYAAKVLGFEIVINDQMSSPEKQIAAVKSLIDEGCDGLIIAMYNDSVIPKIVKMCDDNKVPFVLSSSRIEDPEIMRLAESCRYYLGSTSENDEIMGYNITKSIIDQGARNIAIIAAPPGLPILDDRYIGISKAINETGAKKLAEFRLSSFEASDTAKAIMNFITAYPELDGIVTVFTGNGMGEAILATLNAYNKAGSVKVAGFDLFNTVQTAFKTNTFHSLAGGHYVDPLFSLVILYNYLARTPLSDKPVEINLSFMYFNSIEDIDNFFKYCQGEEFPYNSEEIKQMIKLYNPEMTVDKLKKIASQYSIEDVIARHGK